MCRPSHRACSHSSKSLRAASRSCHDSSRALRTPEPYCHQSLTPPHLAVSKDLQWAWFFYYTAASSTSYTCDTTRLLAHGDAQTI